MKWKAQDGTEYPVVDAEPGTIILIQPTKRDISCAVTGDPDNCALAQAWKRQVDVPAAHIGIDKCYLPMRLGGRMVALRVKTTAAARRAIDHFDRTGEFPPEGFTLQGIPASESIASKRAEAKRLRERWVTIRQPARKHKRSLYVRSSTHPAKL